MLTEKAMVYTALKGWVRHIETGEFAGMDKDIILKLAKEDKNMQEILQELPILTEDQKSFIEKINSLADKVLNTGNI